MADSRDFIQVGLTYRQVDFWTTRGYLRADEASPGCGNNRTWPQSEVRIAELMVRLTDAGLTVEAAHRAARGFGFDGRAELAPGVLVEVAA